MPAKKKTTRKPAVKVAAKKEMLQPNKHWFSDTDLEEKPEYGGFGPIENRIGGRGGKFQTNKPLDLTVGGKVKPGEWVKIVAPSFLTGKKMTFTAQYMHGSSENGAKGHPRGLTFRVGKTYIWFDSIAGGEDITEFKKIAPPKQR